MNNSIILSGITYLNKVGSGGWQRQSCLLLLPTATYTSNVNLNRSKYRSNFSFLNKLLLTLILGICLLPVKSILGQGYWVKGTVYDKETLEPLSFVNMIINNSDKGGVSDIDGRFKLHSIQKPVSLKLSYVGYESLIFVLSDKKEYNIYMKRSEILLNEVTIKPKINPALRIIDSVIQNRDKNNPEMLPSFQYNSHNKVTFGVDTKQLKKKTHKDSADSEEINKMMNKTYLMLIESITNRKYLYPGQNKETVIASKVSGFKDPLFSLIASQLQTFSFYTDYIDILDKKFLNPISPGYKERYLYTLEDTVYNNADTVFIISYKPHPNKNFDGLSGLLYINTNGFAIQNVTAEPADGNIDAFKIKIRQSYEKIDEKYWFPVQLNTELIYTYPQSDMKIFGNGRTYIKDIEINGKISKKEIGNIEYDILPDANEKADSLWKKYRFEPLSAKDMETYKFVDSLSHKHHFERFSGLFKTLMEGRIPYKIFNIDIGRFVGYSNYSGWKLGLGLETNQKVSRFFSLGGYFVYSLKTEDMRYGASATAFIDRSRDISLKYTYLNDDIESARSNNFDLVPVLKINDFRSYLIRRTDYAQLQKASFSIRPLRYLLTKLSVSQYYMVPNYDYMFSKSSGNVNILQNQFSFTEVSLSSRYAYKEKFIQSKDYKYSTGTPYPVFYMSLTRGIKDVWHGNFNYNRVDVGIEKDLFIKQLGTSSFRIYAGYIDSELPYCKLYNGVGSFENFSLFAPFTFNTMRMNEFLSNKYAALFYQHNFGKLLFKVKKFQPEFLIITNYTIGSLSNAKDQRAIEFKTLNKGFLESGLVINDIIHTGFYGLGIGTFYRYGYYSLPHIKDNFALKLALKITL